MSAMKRPSATISFARSIKLKKARLPEAGFLFFGRVTIDAPYTPCEE